MQKFSSDTVSVLLRTNVSGTTYHRSITQFLVASQDYRDLLFTALEAVLATVDVVPFGEVLFTLPAVVTIAKDGCTDDTVVSAVIVSDDVFVASCFGTLVVDLTRVVLTVHGVVGAEVVVKPLFVLVSSAVVT